MATLKASNNNGDDEVDDFFGDDNDDDCFLAEQEFRAVAAKLSNIAYLDAFDTTKETKLQEGFESGYREVFTIASRLGDTLGALTARAKLQESMMRSSDVNIVTDTDMNDGTDAVKVAKASSKRFRDAMDQINKGKETSEDAKGLLLDLEKEIARLTENCR